MTNQSISLSVGKLINFSCRGGDLNHGTVVGPSAREGQAVHKKLQSEAQQQQQSEVSIKTTVQSGEYKVTLRGRIDLLDHRKTIPVVSEIKSCYAPPEKLPESSVSLHLAQLRVYGFCYLRSLETTQDHSQVELQLIWYNVRTKKKTVASHSEDFSSLTAFVMQAVEQYVRWHVQIETKRKAYRESSQALQFPFSNFRGGQRKMAAAIFSIARDKQRLLLEAPTGTGKTISALFAGIKAVGENHIDRIVYLTAKNSGRRAAALALEKLQSAGLKTRALTITAKKTTCFCSNGQVLRNDDGSCPMTIGFFDRLPAAREQLLQHDVINPEDLDRCALDNRVCPFELVQQMLPWMDIIICDYNYVFDPLVRLSFFDEDNAKNLVLVDEAHNLTDRARSMYSAVIDRTEIRHTITACRKDNPLVCKDLRRLDRAIAELARNRPGGESAETGIPKSLAAPVQRCLDTLAQTFEGGTPFNTVLADFSRELFRYSTIAELFDEQHRTITIVAATQEPSSKRFQNARVQLRCLDAADRLKQHFAILHGAAVFSATLRPAEFFVSSLGLPATTPCLSLDSPFDPEQQGTFVFSGLDTRYRSRNASVPPIIELLHSCLTVQAGKYQVFFPSYAYMQQVHDVFIEQFPQIKVIMQSRDSSEVQRKEFLDAFESEGSLLAFAIMGGIYGEGVDYIGERLIGCIVIGTGLPSISLELQLIEQLYTSQNRNGFDYASRYPGFTRVLQTAGRVIRTESDRGIVILADSRFDQRFYRQLMPSHWEPQICADHETLTTRLHEFWTRAGSDPLLLH